MKSSYFRVQSSFITVATLILTLFASQAAEAQARGRGTNGGGGGGVILCPGEAPELTDFWEYKQINKTGDAAARLKAVRGLSYDEANQLYARNLVLFYNEQESESIAARWIDGMMTAAKQAIARPGRTYTYNIGEFSPRYIDIVVDKNVIDPMDSGVIQNLNKTNCKEERVAVTIFKPGEKSDDPDANVIHIRRPDIFIQLSPIEQIALLKGHEFIHSQSKGNIGRLENLGKAASDSSMVRQINAWVATASVEEIEGFLWRPDDSYRVLRCRAAWLDRSKGYPSYEDNSLFILYIDQKKKQTVLEMDMYKSYNVSLPVRADIAFSEDMLMIPAELDTKVAASGPSHGFELNINLQQPIRGKLYQAEAGQNIFSSDLDQKPSLRDTSFSVEIYSGVSQRAMMKVTNSKGETEFDGVVFCQSNNQLPPK